MTALPAEVAAQLESRLGRPPRQTARVDGGMINQAAQVEVGSDTLFVKWRADAPPGFFEAEADGLRRLAATATLRLPQPVLWKDAPAARVPFLAMEWVPLRRPTDLSRFALRFGEGLARLHRESAQPGGAFGLERDNFIGILPQRNAAARTWPEFYRDRRIRVQMRIAKEAGRLPPQRERALETICERMEDLLPADGPPALVHGDLWSGNYLSAGDDAVLVDPAVYLADREVEIAYIELFGGFPPGMLEAYRRAYPLDRGYEQRRPLLQLYPLLVHLNHFGEQYGPDVDRACAPYAR